MPSFANNKDSKNLFLFVLTFNVKQQTLEVSTLRVA